MSRGVSAQLPLQRRLLGALRVLAGALVLAGSQTAQAAPNDQGFADASAQVALLQPLQLIKIEDLEFGRILPSPTAGTVVVNPTTNSCTKTGGVLLFGGCKPALFGGMAARNSTVRVRAPSIVNLTGPGAPMNLSNITWHFQPDLTRVGGGNGNGVGHAYGNQRYRIVSPTGLFTFRVGGTLGVNANQAPGTYVGSVTIELDFQ